MVTAIEPVLRQQLIERRQKLESASAILQNESELTRLLKEVDSALQRMEDGTYGICEVCHDPVETDRLLADPLTRLCIDHLSPSEQRALEDDLALAARIQTGLLPPPNQRIDGWEVAYHYQPARLVSGDYCDLIAGEQNSLHFILGDVSGKGVAASMLMAHLQATFRTLVASSLPIEDVMERASRVFCESTLPTHYATLAYGRTNTIGEVELCNAGHLPPLLVQRGKVNRIAATGLPLGVFCSERFSAVRVKLEKDDTLLLYTDGLSEALGFDGSEFGVDRLSSLLLENCRTSPSELIGTCLKELNAFSDGGSIKDDLTIMAIRRV